LQCPPNFVFDLNNYICVYSASIVTPQLNCPSTAPYWNGLSCVACSLPNYWNSVTQQCLTCPSGSYYNTTLLQCLTCPAGYTFDFSRYLCVSSTTNGSTTNCPLNSQFWNGQSCITCNLPNYWNYNSNSCVSCPVGTNYDTFQKLCLTCPSGQTFDFNLYTCITSSGTSGNCPATAPFWNGQQCVTCYLPQYWNYNTNNC
jgi:hypothetical protein